MMKLLDYLEVKVIAVLAVIYMSVPTAGARELPLPTVPDSLREPCQRAAYVVDHFWDAMDWRDTVLTRDDRFMEQCAANFYSVVNLTDSLTASVAVAKMLDGASVDPEAYRRIAEISQDYLFEPESPVANDETFLVVADRLIADGHLSEADLLRADDARSAAMLNRIGHRAADFEFIDRDGKQRNLSDVLKANSRTILMFYDPDCHDCASFEHHLASAGLSDTGVVMISPYGEQDGLWARHAATMPSEWVVGLPVIEDFEDAGIYDIRATPTVLLLDRNAVVLAKNLTIDTVDACLLGD